MGFKTNTNVKIKKYIYARKDKNQNFIVNIFWCWYVKFEGSSARLVNLELKYPLLSSDFN
jgi:hypothetical protein